MTTDTLHETRSTSAAAPLREVPGPKDAAPAPAAAAGRPHVMFTVLALVLLAGAAFATRQILWGRTHVATDNAQLEGHIIPILPKTAGYVQAVAVSENQRVEEGAVLAELDPREMRARLAQAEADLAGALANSGSRGHTGQSQAQLAAARAAVAQAQANAGKAHDDLARYEALAPRGIVSRQQLDAARSAAQAADAALLAAQKQVSAAAAGVTGADARVEAARALRDQAALNLSYTRLLAPASGVVTRKSLEVGQYVQAGQPVMTVVPTEDVWVVANLKETEIRDVNPGDRAEVEVDAYPGHRFPAKVESLSPATGARFSLLPPDNATGNFTKVVQRIPVRLRITSAPDPNFPLRPGMSAHVVVTTK